MGLHLYALLPAGTSMPAGLTGIDGATVTTITAGPLMALASEHAAAPAPQLDHLQAHNAVAAAAMAGGVTPVPVRFGQFLRDQAAVEARLADGPDHWLDLLRRLHGHAEHGIRMAWPVGEQEMHPAAAAGAGSRHMQQLMQRHAAGRAARDQAAVLEQLVRETTGGCTADTRTDTSQVARGLLGMAMLVAADARSAYDTAVARLPALRPDVRFLITGPWPPYSFVP